MCLLVFLILKLQKMLKSVIREVRCLFLFIIFQKSMRLESANTTLRAEVRRLNVEKEQLVGMLQSHLQVCPMGMLTR